MNDNLLNANKLIKYGAYGFMVIMAMMLLFILIPVSYIEDVIRWIKILYERMNL